MRWRTGVTPVRDRAAQEERRALDALAGRPYRAVLAVSDLHLGEGWCPETGTYPMTENFLSDGAFARFLTSELPGEEGEKLLVLLGDTFDFLRITRVPASDLEYGAWASWLARLERVDEVADLPGRVTGVERRYGLRTQDWKSLWKLLVVVEGHPVFVEALARWLGAGGGVVFAKGNHDLEIYWPLIRRGVRDALVDAGVAPDRIEGRLAFADESFTVGNLYFEHGHQYEGMTRVVGGPVLPGRTEEINLPLGSFVNRYFINRIERLDPFLDNRKPVGQALFALLRRRPVAILRIYTGGFRFLRKALAQTFSRHGARALGLLAVLCLPLLIVPLVLVWFLWPESRGWLLDRLPFLRVGWLQVALPVGGSLLPVLYPYLYGAVREVLRDLRKPHETDELMEGAQRQLGGTDRIGKAFRRVYAVMGHTHCQTVARLVGDGREVLYVNTGTWIPLWPLDRPDLAGRVVYSVTRFLPVGTGGYRHEALEWDDESGELRGARIVVPSAER